MQECPLLRLVGRHPSHSKSLTVGIRMLTAQLLLPMPSLTRLEAFDETLHKLLNSLAWHLKHCLSQFLYIPQHTLSNTTRLLVSKTQSYIYLCHFFHWESTFFFSLLQKPQKCNNIRSKGPQGSICGSISLALQSNSMTPRYAHSEYVLLPHCTATTLEATMVSLPSATVLNSPINPPVPLQSVKIQHEIISLMLKILQWLSKGPRLKPKLRTWPTRLCTNIQLPDFPTTVLLQPLPIHCSHVSFYFIL